MTDETTTGKDSPPEPPTLADMAAAPLAIEADAPPGDTYSVAQVAQLLDVSPKRIRQLTAEGRLMVAQAKPMRLWAQSVHELRDARRSSSRDIRAQVPAPDTEVLVASAIDAVRELMERTYTRQIEAGEIQLAETKAERDRLREDLTAERERAERDREQLRADVERERARADALAARKWWRRS